MASEAFDILTDVKVELSEAEASLNRAEQMANAPEAVRQFRMHSLEQVHSTVKRLRELEKVIEAELFEPA